MALLCGTMMWLSVYWSDSSNLLGEIALSIAGGLLIALGIIDLYL